MDKASKNIESNLVELKENSFEDFYSEKLSLEEKISKILVHINSIDSLSELERVLNNLKLQKSNALSIYDLLSSDISSKVNEELEEIFELQLKSLALEKKMDHLLYYLKTGKVSLPLSELQGMPNSKEYRQFLALYTENTTFLKEILQRKSKLSLLLDSQRILDRKFASKMAKIDYQIISLGRVLQHLDESEKEEVCSLYNMKFERVEGLIANISAFEAKFKKLKVERSLMDGGFIHSGFKKDILSEFKQ